MKITMKQTVAAFILLAALPLGCSRQPVGEGDFAVIWSDYLQREFEEGFDEKQSIFQREKIMRDVVAKYNIDFSEFKKYMQKKHGDKYSRIFLDQATTPKHR